MLRRLVLATLLCASFSVHAQLPAPVAQALAQQGLPEDALGVLVLKGDTTVLSHQADRPMQPASTMKLVTTMVSLERLGPAFRGRTELRTTGEIDKGVLRGNLVLKGGADADLSGQDLENMLRALYYQGIRRIEGDLVLDRSLWQPARMEVGLPPFDESPEAYYNVIPDALMVNKNMLQIDMRSTSKRLKLEMQPELDRVSIGSDMTLIDADCAKWEDGWKLPEAVRQKNGRIQVILHGTFPKDCARSYSINVLDRNDYIERLFRQKWKELDGKFSGKVVEGTAPPESRVLAEHTSRMLPELVRDTNKPSDNLLARTLFLSLGSLQPDPAAGSFALPPTGEPTFVRADAAVREWMRAHRIDDTGLVMENGSGLSRTERITAQQMAYLLQAGLRSNWMPEFQASMPIAGIDGTLRRRLQGTPAAGRARLKTGTLRNVVALAGYVPDANGVQNVFVAIVNSEQAGNGRGRAVLDALVDWVARSGAVQQQPAAPAAP
ncbi:D-alanyl-D-alanine carboxypeptidase/D-alanyl-D-alanine-endopeptidase [Massilia sp. IC2-476]|uniref:D-alanyl-D-alanine carboxypeptidase/D-alanyl-D-alanine endopeptidase n=1 Tax=Massilia sp. IC2-476 TaxID=2887199 RepID=UPI001D0FBA02|nr:D-alanyl-D-alanine carboxypeptidase/D-alanyl-D-alanine-endopeptidase [Massilia sp. IC2-476]MCC2972821.1 D-alanyl-D-alanine carboxypeptidase/D-alanyl-D-alanine-endopeptidase [Massilia sp. IC2-476]